jgi:hypothetical protein
MQKLLFLIGILVCCAAQHTAQHQTDRERFQYLGPVKSAQTVKYQLQERDGKTITGPPVLERAETFDALGFMTSQTYLQAGSAVLKKDEWKNTYNSQGQLISREARLADLPVRCLEQYHYDESGRITETQRIYRDVQPMLVLVAYTYDEVGRVQTETSRTGRSNLPSTHYTYDAQGRLTRVRHFNDSSQRSSQTLYLYQPGNLKTTIFIDDMGKESAKWIEQHDEFGNLIKGTYYSAKGLWKKSWVEYEFDARSNWTKARIRREIYDQGPLQVEQEILKREIAYH